MNSEFLKNSRSSAFSDRKSWYLSADERTWGFFKNYSEWNSGWKSSHLWFHFCNEVQHQIFHLDRAIFPKYANQYDLLILCSVSKMLSNQWVQHQLSTLSVFPLKYIYSEKATKLQNLHVRFVLCSTYWSNVQCNNPVRRTSRYAVFLAKS